MSTEKFRLFDTLIEGVHVITYEWNYAYVNPASAEQFSLNVQDMLYKNMYDVFPMVKDSKVEVQLKKTMLERQNFNAEMDFIFPNSAKRWYDIKIRPVEEGILVMMLDITEKKEQQLKLREKEVRYKELYNSMVESYVIFEPIFNEKEEFIDLRFLEVNKASFKLYGERKEIMIGRLRSELFGPMDEEFIQKVNKVISTKEIVKYEREVSKLNLWIGITMFKVRENEIALLSTDITDRVNYQEQLKSFNKKLELMIDNKTRELSETLEREKVLTQLQGKFLSMAAHELKAPLSSINVCLEVMGRNSELADNINYTKYSGYIHEELENLLGLVTELISPTNRIISNMGNERESLNINDLIGNVKIGLGQLTRKNQEILHKHKGENIVSINRDILRRILTNLLSNAIKYSKEDIIIKTECCATFLNLAIIDTGIGIPAAEQSKIFQKYYRSSKAEKIMGSGLGLNVVKTYVEMLNGSINFESKEDVGTTFHVKIPI